MKRGQGLPVNMIIIAAIALVVLIVLIAIASSKLGGFSSKLSNISEGKSCVSPNVVRNLSECSSPILDNFNNLEGDQVCCKS